MATCDPKLLPAQATCFHCAEPGSLKQIQLYLLSTLLGNASAASLEAGAANFRPFTGKIALAAQVYLFAVITGSSTNPSTLEKLAACWWCIPESERLNVSTYLLATSAGTSTDPKVLAKSMAPFRPLIPIYEQVKVYAFANLAGGLSPNAVMAGATCFLCLDHQRLEEIYLYLLCLGVSMNLIPGGSHYGPGGSPEFDLAVLANTCYQVTFGSNDLSMKLCGTTFTSLGVGSTIIVCTGACTLMQFFGTFAGTTVTAIVKPVKNPIPAPTGFTWSISGANAIATWNAPPAGIFSTELWTSTDNITFTLAATVATPGTTVSVAAPASGSTLYAMIRFTSKVFPGYSAFTSVLFVVGLDPVVSDWVNRVIANGGAMPSSNTQTAANTFVTTLKGGTNVWSKLGAVNMYAPDSLIAAITPLLKGIGNDPWTNHGFLVGDLTVNGLIGDGASKYLETGYNPNGGGSVLTDSSNGLVAYVFTDATVGVQGELSVLGPGAGPIFGLYTHYNVTLNFFGDWLYNGGAADTLTWASPVPATGYFSGQRTGASAAAVYFANSTNAHAALVSTAAIKGSSIVGHPVIAFAAGRDVFSLGPADFSAKRDSFHALTSGLSSADDNTLFNAVQALRTAFGGGFV